MFTEEQRQLIWTKLAPNERSLARTPHGQHTNGWYPLCEACLEAHQVHDELLERCWYCFNWRPTRAYRDRQQALNREDRKQKEGESD